MAQIKQDTAALAARIIGDVRSGNFAPVYLLMGAESYYPDKVCDEIVKHAMSDEERDFNQSVLYGPDTNPIDVGSQARCYPMMAERRLVVVKELQSMKGYEQLSVYCEEPMESTVLVLVMHGAAADKRKSLYKNVSKKGVVLESPLIRDRDLPEWIYRYFQSRGLDIQPDAAALLAESTGTDLSRIVAETDKMLMNLPEGTRTIRAEDIEKNVGISRQFSVFELTAALSYKNAAKALKICAHIGAQPKFVLLMVTGPLFVHFYRILKYEALLFGNPAPSSSDKAAALGVNPYFFKEYDAAVRNYPLRKCMRVLSVLEEFDLRGKGGMGGETKQDELLMELITRILNV